MVAFIQRVSLTMPTPTLVNGRPDSSWVPTIFRENWGKLQLIIDGVGMTKPRGLRFIPIMDAQEEPFGDAEARFAFPGLTEFDDLDNWNLKRLAKVRLRRKDPAGVFHILYEGEIASVDSPETPEHGVEIQCVGALFRLDLLKEPPALIQTEKDYGDIIAHAFNNKRRRHALHLGQMEHVTTGIRGTQGTDFQPFLTGTIQDYLSQMTTDDGGQWTVKLQRPRTPKLIEKDLTTVDATVSFGAPDVKVAISRDFTTGITAVYGSGSNGHCTWLGAKFPNLVGGDTPSFPLSSGATFTAGSGTGGFAPFAAYLRRGQYGTIVSDDTYDSADVDNVEQFQDRAGLTVDGIVGAQTWEAAFEPGANQGSLRGAYVSTIFERTGTEKLIYNAQGAEVGNNPNFDPTIPRIEDYVAFGDNVSKNLGRKSAKQIVNRSHPVGYTGTITLSSDPTEKSRWLIAAGDNVQLDNFRGDGPVLFHVARRQRNWQDGTVELTVDSKARDLQTLAAIHQRHKDVSDITRRQRFGRRRSKLFNDYGTWLCEDGAGEIPLMSQQGGFWNVQKIAAAPKGSVARVSLAFGTGLTEHLLNVNLSHHPNATISGAARGAVLITTEPITPRQLSYMDGMDNPLQYMADGVTNPWDANEDRLTHDFGKVFAAGGPGAALGFHPGNDPGDGTDVGLSGRFEDGGGFDFGPTGKYWLWIAIWCPDSCKVGGRIFPGAPA